MLARARWSLGFAIGFNQDLSAWVASRNPSLRHLVRHATLAASERHALADPVLRMIESLQDHESACGTGPVMVSKAGNCGLALFRAERRVLGEAATDWGKLRCWHSRILRTKGKNRPRTWFPSPTLASSNLLGRTKWPAGDQSPQSLSAASASARKNSGCSVPVTCSGERNCRPSDWTSQNAMRNGGTGSAVKMNNRPLCVSWTMGSRLMRAIIMRAHQSKIMRALRRASDGDSWTTGSSFMAVQ